MEEVREWQNRPLERLYPVVFFDALCIKIGDEGTVKQGRLSGGSGHPTGPKTFWDLDRTGRESQVLATNDDRDQKPRRG